MVGIQRDLTPITLSPKEARFMIHLVGKFRRCYLVYFRKEYVKRQLASRKGECHQCAQCCSFVFHCPMLTQGRLCRTYDKFRLGMCRSFPIDQRDVDEVARRGGTCGYRFEKSLHHPHSFQTDLSKRIEALPD
jgi:hypothetical protein